MAIFFTADTHFGHDNMIRYCNRPFKDRKAMDTAMFTRWNATVKHDDVVYHIGDVAFGDIELQLPLLKGLMGKKFLVPGNHDLENGRLETLAEAFEVLPPMYDLKLSSRKYITLCHYKMEVWNKSHNGSIQLYGHTHGRLAENNRQLDVGVDCWNFTPASLESITQKLVSLPERTVDKID